MRRIGLEVIAVALTLALIALALEKAFQDYRTPLDLVLGPLKAADRVTLLIVGNSHTGALGTLPLRADDLTYNASVGGQDIYRSYLVLRAFLPRLPRLREAVVALDYDAVGYNFSVFNQDWQDRQYYPYTQELYHDGAVQRLLAKSAFFRANRDLRALFVRGAVAPMTNPVLPVTGSMTSGPEACRKRAKEHSEVKFREELIGQNADYLQRIVALANHYNIDVHFLNTPKAACYRENYSAVTRQTGEAAIARALGAQKAKFHDYFEEPTLSEDDFLDDDHLSPAGSAKIMRDLAARTAASSSSTLVR